MNYEIEKLEVHGDGRGWLVEALKQDQIPDGQSIRQIYVASIKPGCVRGNHYHKKRMEWFFLIGADAEIHLEDMETKEKKVIFFSSEAMQRVAVYPNVAHAVANKGSETVYLVSAQNDIFDPNDKDSFEHKIVHS
jgi:UDP-2-acetamido-2,6-beta-L-arabino-hexul-4-ose reductase